MKTDSQRLRAIGWWGGKNNKTKLMDWILATLPPVVERQIYVEPFAGMLGVLLNRAPAKMEVINDLDLRVAKFWRVMRDQPDALEARLDNTESGRTVFAEAHEVLANVEASDLDVAWALVVISGQGWQGKPSAWDNSVGRANAGRNIYFRASCLRLTGEAMRERIRSVMVECRDGIDVIKQYGKNKDAVLYCDPPYPETATSFYECELDYERFIDVLEKVEGRVAVSGYPHEMYDRLGWNRFEYGNYMKGAKSYKTECLWTNYEPDSKITLL